MKHLNFKLLAFLFCFSQTVLATTSDCTQNPCTDDKLVEMLKNDLLLTTKTLSRDIKAYNWFNGGYYNDDLDLEADYFKTKFLSTTKLFWDYNRNQGLNVGPALYAATDTMMSQDWGNTLIEVMIPAGTKFIDIRGGDVYDHFDISKKTVMALNQVCQGKVASLTGNEFYKTISGKKVSFLSTPKQNLTKAKACHGIFNRAIKELDIRFVTYQWAYSNLDWSRNSGVPNDPRKGCEPSVYSSFIILGQADRLTYRSADLTLGKIKIYGYTNNIGPNPSPEKLEKYRYIDHHTRLTYGEKSKWPMFDRSWRELDTSFNTLWPFMDKMKHSMFDCMPSIYKEDAIPKFEFN